MVAPRALGTICCESESPAEAKWASRASTFAPLRDAACKDLDRSPITPQRISRSRNYSEILHRNALLWLYCLRPRKLHDRAGAAAHATRPSTHDDMEHEATRDSDADPLSTERAELVWGRIGRRLLAGHRAVSLLALCRLRALELPPNSASLVVVEPRIPSMFCRVFVAEVRVLERLV